MNDLIKDALRRWFQGFGLRLQKYPFYKYPQDKHNYPELASRKGSEIMIFDVGANIGQTSKWFRLEFPEAKIHAFEPFGAIFNELQKNTANLDVTCHHLAFSDTSDSRDVPLNTNPLGQTGSIEVTGAGHGETEKIRLETVDAFCASHGIRSISILKTDTEGHDANVLKGASGMLAEGRIENILSEATIDPHDDGHTNLFGLMEFLAPFGYELYSMYDLNHNHLSGKLQYFNALFKRKAQ